MEKNSLVSVYRNIDYLTNYMEKNADYDEYEYSYRRREFAYYNSKGKAVYHYVTRYDYSKDIDHDNLTGDARTVHTKYYLYNITKDENGKYVMNKSDLVDDVTDPEIIENYPYFKVGDFSKKEYYDYEIDTKTKVRK